MINIIHKLTFLNISKELPLKGTTMTQPAMKKKYFDIVPLGIFKRISLLLLNGN
jgi:hypothetical protein